MYRPTSGVICLLCRRSVLRKRRITISQILFDENPGAAVIITENLSPYQILFNNAEHICRPCWQGVLYNAQGRNVDEVQNEDNVPAPPHEDEANVENVHDVTTIELPTYSRPPNTSNACIFHACRLGGHHRISDVLRKRLLMNLNYYVPRSARVCTSHLNSEDWEELPLAPNLSHRFNTGQISDIINLIKQTVEGRRRFDFENLEQLDEDELYYWTGRTREEFSSILNQTPSLSECYEAKTALGIMLAKLTTGEPNERLALIFHMNRRKLERLMKTAREALTRDFVTQHLGWDHVNRETLLQRNLSVPNGLFGSPDNNKLIVVCDGTYIYIHKSSNFGFQIKTYSPHKYSYLLKVFPIVCSDGYIIEVTGPHGVKTSDATIIRNILNQDEHPFHVFFNQGDVFILDRGFRDAISDLEAFGYQAHMPSSVAAGETQLTTLQANYSRMLTMCRWVVEVVNGRFKRDFKLFRQEYFHNAMPHMIADFRIAAAILNAFHVPIVDNQNATG